VVREAIKHMEAALKEMEERLKIPGDGEKDKDPVYDEIQTKMRALVEKLNKLAGRMGLTNER